MLAFHGKQETKDFYLKRVRWHQEQDHLTKGVYYEDDGKGNIKVCGVGCTIHGNDHSAYERELGIPQWVARLEDRIFEGLPMSRAKLWPAEFLEAIKPGVDLQKVLIPMLIFIVESARETTKKERSLSVIDGVLKELRTNPIDSEKLRVARSAAAAYASDAAYAAAASAASAAAYAAADASDAASDAAAASAAAYASAARESAYIKFADKLLELMKGCV